MMRPAAALGCGFLAACLAACDGHADGKCTEESLQRNLPPELAALVKQRDTGLTNLLCSAPDEAPWTIMFREDVLRCTDKNGKRTCTVPKINGITFTVESDTAEPRVNTANVKLSEDRLAPLLRDDRVRYIAPNCRSFRRAPAYTGDKTTKGEEVPPPIQLTGGTEPACTRQDSAPWGVADACVPASHEDAGSPKVIAVLDSGIDCRHPAIYGRVGDSKPPTDLRRCAANSGTNYVYPWLPPDHCTDEDPNKNPDKNPFSCDTHGTAVAGIIASSAPEVPGVDPGAKLVSMRVLYGNSETEFVQPWTKVATAILDSGERAQILNISANWYTNYPWLAAAIDRVTADHRHLVVAAARAGNGPTLPAEFTKCNRAVIGVSDIRANPHQWPPYYWGINDNDEAYLVAAGLHVLTSYSDETTLGSGTTSRPMSKLQAGASFAAPHVTGAASLIWSTKKFESCSAEGVRALLECSSRITLIGENQKPRKRLHLGCLFSQRNSLICEGARRCIESVLEQYCP